ncbi:MAG: hypothetical protein ACR2M8_07855 [Pyrinomonadaceae bacterium]|nr:hypothetical protein [Blastocatellia bacterium]MDQ3220494.1 hypothetical protein [Acidobacteriota bacterium]
MKKVDMSEQAILRRLKTVDKLRELCLCLMKSNPRLPKPGRKADAIFTSGTETRTSFGKKMPF